MFGPVWNYWLALMVYHAVQIWMGVLSYQVYRAWQWSNDLQ